jgi:hypothetical protein
MMGRPQYDIISRNLTGGVAAFPRAGIEYFDPGKS